VFPSVTFLQLCFGLGCHHSLSLLSLSEYAPSRLRDDDPFCVALALEASLVDVFKSVKKNLKTQIHVDWAFQIKDNY